MTPLGIGLVGTGRWGSKLADKLQAAGATIVAHDRAGRAAASPELGRRQSWQQMFTASDIDALVVATPPEVTLEVATAAAAVGRPVLATKPLMLPGPPKPLMLPGPLVLRAPFFVDYVGLWAPAWRRIRHIERYPAAVEITFCGTGPVRNFPGLLDYGAHALAFAHDLCGLDGALRIERAEVVRRTAAGGHLVDVEGSINGTRVSVTTGNGAEIARRCVLVHDPLGGSVYEDDPSADPLGLLVADFIAAVRTGHVNHYYADLTCRVTESLNTIRRACALDP